VVNFFSHFEHDSFNFLRGLSVPGPWHTTGARSKFLFHVIGVGQVRDGMIIFKS